MAAKCGPAIATYTNPAKTLAAELSEALPVLWSDGDIAALAARRLAALITARAGRPAITAELPEALTAHEALLAGTLAGSLDPDDFFRDRVEDPEGLRLRLVLLQQPDAHAAGAAPAARELAMTHDTPLSELAPAEGSVLEAAPTSSPSRISPLFTWRSPPAGDHEPHVPPDEHRAPLRLGIHHRHPRAAGHRTHR